MRIGPKLLLNSVFVSVFAVITTALLIGGMSYNRGKNILEDQARDKLILLRDMKAHSVARYFDTLIKQLQIFSNNPMVINAMNDLDKSFFSYAKEVNLKGMDKYKDEVIKHYISEFSRDYANDNNGMQFDATPYLNVSNESTFALQYNYIFNNPFGIDKESKMEYVDDGSNYSKFHSKYHSYFREFKELFDFEDIFLVDANTGEIVYSVAKGLDFTTSLINGPYAKTTLGDAFRKANTSDGTKPYIVSDFAPYSPSNDDQAAFIATNIFDHGKKVGVVILQINAKTLNSILTSRGEWQDIGMGDTGEIYLVDANNHMLTDSRFLVEKPQQYYEQIAKQGTDQDTINRIKAKNSSIGLQKLDTLGAKEVAQGKTGFAIYPDYRGIEVLGAYQPLDVQGLHWGIISEIDKSEAFAPVAALAKKMAINLTGVMVLITLFSTIVGIGLAKQISLPIENLSSEVLILSETRDLTKRIDTGYVSNDEIGGMALALNKLIESFQETCQETISSTQKVQSTAHKLIVLADEIEARESMHKMENNYDTVHEKTNAIKAAGDNLTELSSKLQLLSRQFKVFEEESERASGW